MGRDSYEIESPLAKIHDHSLGGGETRSLGTDQRLPSKVSLGHFSPHRQDGKQIAQLVIVFPKTRLSSVSSAMGSIWDALGCGSCCNSKDTEVAAKEKAAEERIFVLHAISDAGLAFEWLDDYRAVVYASPRRLMREAVRMRLPMKLDCATLRKLDVEMNLALATHTDTSFDPTDLEKGHASTRSPMDISKLAIPTGISARPDFGGDGKTDELRASLGGCRGFRGCMCRTICCDYCSPCKCKQVCMNYEVGCHGDEPDPYLLDPYDYHFVPLEHIERPVPPFVVRDGSESATIGLTEHDRDKVDWEIRPLHLSRRLIRKLKHSKTMATDFLPLPLTSPEALRVLSSIIASKAEILTPLDNPKEKDTVRRPREGAGIDLDKLVVDGWVEDYFLLHDNNELTRLSSKWMKWGNFPWIQPLDEIRRYFGERIGFYFAFLGHLSAWLTPLAVFGVAIGCISIGFHSSRANPSLAAVPIILALWTMFFLSSWRQRQSILALRWGVLRLPPTTRHVRPVYEQDTSVNRPVRSPATGIAGKYDIAAGRRHRSILANMIFILFFSSVGGLYFLLSFLKNTVNDNDESPGEGIAMSLLFAVFIAIVGAVSPRIIEFLTSMEHWKYQDDHEHLVLLRSSILNIFNNFGAVSVIGFIYPLTTPCPYNGGDCSLSVTETLGTTFISLILINNIMELASPLGKILGRTFFGSKEKEESLSTAPSQVPSPTTSTHSSTAENVHDMENDIVRRKGQQDCLTRGFLLALSKDRKRRPVDTEGYGLVLSRYDVDLDDVREEPAILTDYNEVMVQIGWVLFFFVFFPAAPFLAWANNWFEVRIDAAKVMWAQQRPLPVTVGGIGAFETIFRIFSYLAVVSNVALLALNTNKLEDGSDGQESNVLFGRGLPDINANPLNVLGVLATSALALLLLMLLLEYVLPREHPAVEVQLQRKQHLVRRFVYQDWTDDEDEAIRKVKAGAGAGAAADKKGTQYRRRSSVRVTEKDLRLLSQQGEGEERGRVSAAEDEVVLVQGPCSPGTDHHTGALSITKELISKMDKDKLISLGLRVQSAQAVVEAMNSPAFLEALQASDEISDVEIAFLLENVLLE